MYRGFHVPLTQVSHEFQQDKVVWFVSITSTTTDEKHTLKFFGSGIKAFSAIPLESELVFSSNTCFIN